MVITHLVDDGKAGQLVTSSAQFRTARLEALLNADADAADGRTCLRADIQQTFHGLAVGEEVVQNQHLVRGGEELLGKRDVIITAIGVGMDGGGVDLAVNILALGLLGKDNRHVEMPRGHAGDGDAGCLDGQNLVDACKMGDGTVDDALKALILVIKENIKVRRFARYEGHCAAYVHGGGTHGVIVKFETSDDVAAKPEFAAFGKDIAMQVAAANPSYLNESDVPEDVLAKEKEIVLAQMANDPKTANKPDAIKEKMAIGKLGKFYKEACLVDQAFIKDGGMDVKKYVADTAKALGGDIKIAAFTHFTKGEGLEKRNEDFAAEVAAAIKG